VLSRRRQGTLAAALVASLLLCHGVAGPAHPHHAGAEGAATAPAHHSAHPHGAEKGGDIPGDHGGGILDCYASVLLAAALGIAARSGAVRGRFSAVARTLAPPRWRPTGLVLCRSRAPGPALLGMFLL
jgi:hypothetical protein